jgi:flagellar biosynthesis protein FlhF
LKLKVFTADSMSAALDLVKKELGPGAVILHTRSYRRGGLWGLLSRTVVEITAADSAVLGNRRPGPAGAKPAAGRGPRRAPSPADNRSADPLVPASATAGDLIRRTYAMARAEMAQAAPAPAAPAPDPMALPAGAEQLAQEMRCVKRLVEQMVRQQRQRQGPASFQGSDMPDKLFDQYLNLLKQEVTEELAEEVVQQVRATLGPAQLEQAPAVRRAVLDALARLIPTDAAAGQLPPSTDGRPRTIALIGPTGVGKTTTIAKLAANFKLKQRKNVGLITLDTYRIAAVDQLRTYAGIIGVPLHVAAGAGELADALRRCRAERRDVVLIDTAGRSQRDDPHLEQLAGSLRAADPHEVHLVLSSTCTQAVLLETAERFARVRADRIIFTKLDEAVSFGVLLNVARKVHKKLSFVTTGQEVPHHIEPGRPDRLAALMLGERI